MRSISLPFVTWLRKITGHIPVSFYQAYFKRDILFFFYHVISAEPLPHIKHLYAYKSPEMFERDLNYLLENYNLISYEQLVAYHQGRIQLKPNSAFLSFDDGCHECFTVARPLLRKYGVPCTFFITTDFIDNQKMACTSKVSLCIERVVTGQELWKQDAYAKLSRCIGRLIENEIDFIRWIKSLQFIDSDLLDQVCEMLGVDIAGYLKSQKPFMSLDELRILASDGFTIGAHSKSHPLFERISAEAIEREIVESCQMIQKITGAESIPFAFPFHGNGLNWRLLEEISSRNQAVGIMFDTNGINKYTGLVIDRIWADAPEFDGSHRSNLPERLYLSYQELILDWFRKYKRFFPASV